MATGSDDRVGMRVFTDFSRLVGGRVVLARRVLVRGS
jgi:hypothetical protein